MELCWLCDERYVGVRSCGGSGKWVGVKRRGVILGYTQRVDSIDNDQPIKSGWVYIHKIHSVKETFPTSVHLVVTLGSRKVSHILFLDILILWHKKTSGYLSNYLSPGFNISSITSLLRTMGRVHILSILSIATGSPVQWPDPTKPCPHQHHFSKL